MGSIKKFFLRFWPVIFILSVWFVFSSPYFLQNKVPYPSKYQVTFFSPWSYYPEFAGPVKNNAMPDVIDQIYPWKYFTIQSLKNGQIPLWNPYSFAGNPHVANFQSAVFSPFNILFFMLPFIDAWSLLVLLQSLLAGLFTYLFLREAGVSKTGAVIGGVSFMFCGFIVVWMAYGTLAMAIALLPLALFAIERVFNKKSLWSFLLLSIALATSYFSGHVQTSLYFTVFCFLFVIFKLITTKNFNKFFLTLFFLFLGLILASLQVIPTLLLYGQSVRSDLVYQGGQIPLNYLVTILAPDFFGNPVTRNDWVGSYAEWASFIGIIPFVLALFAFSKTKHKYNYFFATVGILALLFSSDTPLRQLLTVSNIPVFATSIPSRMIVVFSFSFAVLSGFGFDSLVELVKKKALKKIVIPLAIVTTILLVAWSLLLIFHVLPDDKTALAVRNLVLPTGIFFFTAFVILFARSFLQKKALLVLGIMLVVFTAFDSLRFATKWVPFDERSLVYPNIQVINEIKKRAGNERVFGNLGTQVEAYYGIQSLEGYDPLYIQRYGDFIHSSYSGDYQVGERSVAQLAQRGKYTERVLDLLGVGLIFHPLSDTEKEWAFPVWEDYKKYSVVYQDDKFQLYRNNTVMQRATLFYQYEVIKQDKEVLKRFYTEDFDFRNILLLEEDPKLISNLKSQISKIPGKNESSVEITSYTPNKVVISVETDRPALLFLSDSYYPAWKAKVNGKEEKIYRADYAFRAVKVPSGNSTVEFEYRGLF